MNSNREIRKGTLSARCLPRQSECWVSAATVERSTKAACVTALAGNSKLKEISFSSHENSKQRLVRDN